MTTGKVDTRQHILDTARKIIVHSGYAASGLTEVLKEAGVPKGSFYHYFPSKDAFGVELLKAYFDEYLATMNRIDADRTKAGAERLMEYWQWFYDVQSTDDCQGQCLVVKLAAEVSDLSEAMRRQLEVGTAAIIDRLAGLIAGGIADGSLMIDGDAMELAESLYDSWLGASVIAKVQRKPDALQRAMSGTRKQLHLQ